MTKLQPGWKLNHLLFLFLLSLLLLSSCSFGGDQSTATSTPTPTLVPGSNLPSPTLEGRQSLTQTEQLLLMTPHPLRDLYSLARRLKLHTTQPIPHVGRTTPLNAHLGQEDSFWLNNSDTRSYSSISARLVYITPHVYMYVEDGQQVNLAALQSSADIFETQIYPTSENDTVHQYAAEYYDILPRGHRGTLTIRLTGAPTIRVIGNDPYEANNEWWSNRYDNMDSTLTRSFDLTNLRGKRATLEFATWFDLERDYDYAFNVLLLVYSGQTFSVSTMTIDPTTDQGTLTVPNFGSRIPHVVLIVSAYAAETTLLAHYQLDVSLS